MIDDTDEYRAIAERIRKQNANPHTSGDALLLLDFAEIWETMAEATERQPLILGGPCPKRAACCQDQPELPLARKEHLRQGKRCRKRGSNSRARWASPLIKRPPGRHDLHLAQRPLLTIPKMALRRFNEGSNIAPTTDRACSFCRNRGNLYFRPTCGGAPDKARQPKRGTRRQPFLVTGAPVLAVGGFLDAGPTPAVH